jgi:type IV secretion system protein VirB10
MHKAHFYANLWIMRGRFFLTTLLIGLFVTWAFQPLRAADSDRDFSGKWRLDTGASDISSLGQVETNLTVSQGGGGIHCSTGADEWSYALDGTETRKQIGGESRSSVTKWEGSALLVNTQVTGPGHYTVMDRWKISRSQNTLTITRQVVRANGESEGTLVFRREGAPVAAPQSSPATAPAGEAPAAAGWRQAEPGSGTGQPALASRPAPGAPPDITVPTGTRVLLSLINEVNTKHAHEGDHVYLRTASPVAVSGRVVIPRGSDVEGVITKSKAAGKVVGKGELYIRFDSLILPNGISRDFRARPPGEEGKVEGHGKSADGRTVIEGAGAGGAIGAMTHGLGGAAIGGVGGALAGVLLSRNQNVVLPAGTHLEMVLDRDLVFHPDELP